MSRTKIMIAGGVILAILAVCTGLHFWNVFQEQAIQSLQANAVINEHIGQITKWTFDAKRTGEEEGDDVFVFAIEGEKGSGSVVAEFVTVDADNERIDSGVLKLPSGEARDLITGSLVGNTASESGGRTAGP